MSFPSRQLFLLLCAGVLVLAGGAVVAADSADRSPGHWESAQLSEHSPVMIDVDNSTNYLSPSSEDVKRAEYQPATLDVAGAVEGDAIRLQGEHQKDVLEERLENTDDNDAIAVETVRALERDLAALERQQHQLYQSYSDGELDTATLFREIARLDVTSDQYRDIATIVDDQTLLEEIDRHYPNPVGDLPLLPSPFASHVETELRTNGETPMYVQSGNDSLVLATVEGNTYLREAVLLGERDRNVTDQFGTGNRSEADDAFARAGELYPWTIADADRPELRGFQNTTVYRLQASHNHGELQTYIDGATTNPFYEIQEKNSLEVPVDFSQTLNDSLRLDIERTNPTGPMRVEVIETGGQEFENVTITIDGNTIKTLSESGAFYTIQPRGSFEISAETDTGREVSRYFPSS